MPREREYTSVQLRELQLSAELLPRHVAIIMDGNGRWARSRGLPRIEGHRRGVNTVRTIVEECSRLGLEQITLYCFSSENWKRPEREQNLLMHLLKQFVVEERSEILRQDLRFRTIGRTDAIEPQVLREVAKTIECSRDNGGMTLCLALNYGSRSELVDACRRIATHVQAGELDPQNISEDTITSHLYTSGMADPDLLIRTAGEMRVSNFLLWQISYAELWVTARCWPEFGRADLLTALQDYAARERRYGGLPCGSETDSTCV